MATPGDQRRARGGSSGSGAPGGGGRHGKTRPTTLAQLHLAVLRHAEAHANGPRADEPLVFDDDTVRAILDDHSGAKTRHGAATRNARSATDPLCHILSGSTLCGAGTDPTAFGADPAHLGVRIWYRRLAQVREGVDALRQGWGQPLPPPDHTDAAPDPLADLRAPCGPSQIHYPPARPLW